MSNDSRRMSRSPAVITGVRASLPRELPAPIVHSWPGPVYTDKQRIAGEYKNNTLYYIP